MEPDKKQDPHDHSSLVSKHYDKVSKSEAALYKERSHSPIFQLRKFNNFCKNVLIQTYVSLLKQQKRPVRALDLCCGRGGDLGKWSRAGVNYLLCADISNDSIDECVSRYSEMGEQNSLKAEFLVSDCASEHFWDRVAMEPKIVDLTTCQFALHYAFENFQKATVMLHNACAHLSPGGYFLGIIPNSFEILRHFKKKGFGKISNDVFEIQMTSFENQLFGAVYHFRLDELVDCPEFLIYFPLLKEMLKRHNMRCVRWEPLSSFFLDTFRPNLKILERMRALKCFTRDELANLTRNPVLDHLNYSHIKDALDKGRLKGFNQPLSMSVDEWQVIRFYSVFVFQRDPTMVDPLLDIRQRSSNTHDEHTQEKQN